MYGTPVRHFAVMPELLAYLTQLGSVMRWPIAAEFGVVITNNFVFFSPPQLSVTKSQDRKQSLLDFIVGTVLEEFPDVAHFHEELDLEKASKGRRQWRTVFINTSA